MCWYAQLEGYVFNVIHTKRKENSNDDALSRAKHLPEPIPSENKKYREISGTGRTPYNV